MLVSVQHAWRSRATSVPVREAASFAEDALVLGAGTVLLRLDKDDTVTLRPDAAHDRMIALLAVAGRGALAKSALPQIAAAVADWRRGDRGLAAIRLAFAPLPRVRDRDDAYRLFLAETALDAGLSPNDLLEELGYSCCSPLLKFDPNQPRVPAGSGARSGQWTSGGATAAGAAAVPAASKPAPPSAASKPTPGAIQGVELTPIFFRPEDGDAEDQFIGDKRRWLGLDDTEEERIEEGRPLRPPVPGPIGPAGPGGNLFDQPETPKPGIVPVPSPAPGGSDPSPQPAQQDQDQKGLACPPQRNDVPRGPNPSGDEFEYLMSLLINPEDPTPKRSIATPNVTSQAYFLPSGNSVGQTSFDDCKKGGTLTPIPGIKPGDMVEDKAPGWGWVLFAPKSQGFNQFEAQIRNQNEAVAIEGRGRQIFYCLGDEAAVKRARFLYWKYNNSHFLVCHRGTP